MKKILKKFLIVLSVILVLAVIWFGTVLLQKPPKYPTMQMDIDKYFEEHRMNYSVSKVGLIKDVDAFIGFTDELHADPYRIISKSAFLRKAQEVKSKIKTYKSDMIPIYDAYYFLQELSAFLEDGHTGIYHFNWKKTEKSLFPLTFTSIDGKIFVKDIYGVNDIPERVEIAAINEISIKQITDDVMKYISGTLLHLKQKRIAETLSMFVQTYYKMQSPWRITYVYNGRNANTLIQGISYESFEKAAGLRREYNESEIVISGKSVPVLEANFLGFEGNSEWDNFKAFIDDFFTRNKDKQYLIIDVRYNLGGNGDWLIYILSYLTSSLKGYEEFSFKVSPLHKEIIRYGIKRTYYDMHLPKFLWSIPIYKFVKQDDPYYWIARDILDSKIGSFYYTRWENEKSFLTDKAHKRFHGKVFFLTSYEAFSAGVVFAGLFKSNSLGTIIGQETGGRVYMSSDIRPVLLPNSNLMYLVPAAKLIVNDENPDRGVMPDITIDLSPEDYINNIDRDIEKVIELIKVDMGSGN